MLNVTKKGQRVQTEVRKLLVAPHVATFPKNFLFVHHLKRTDLNREEVSHILGEGVGPVFGVVFDLTNFLMSPDKNSKSRKKILTEKRCQHYL